MSLIRMASLSLIKKLAMRITSLDSQRLSNMMKNVNE